MIKLIIELFWIVAFVFIFISASNQLEQITGWNIWLCYLFMICLLALFIWQIYEWFKIILHEALNKVKNKKAKE